MSASAPFKDDEDEGIVRFDLEENSSWFPACCCAPCDGEKGEEEEETDVARLLLWREVPDGGGCWLDTGEKVLREGLWLKVFEVSRRRECWLLGKAVDMGATPREPQELI